MSRLANRLPPLPTIQEIIRVYGLTAKKQLAQNFLLDLNLTNKIVKSAGKLDNGFVIEVGPGPGGITRSILNTGAKEVFVIEKDRRFLLGLEILSEASKHRLKAVHGDVLHYNMQLHIPEEYKTAWEDDKPKVHIIGNLPFNVATPLIIQWLRAISTQTNAWSLGRVPLTLTFQKEVAERIVAAPSAKQRCRLSVMSQLFCDSTLTFIIPGKAFVPPPKVDVGIIHMKPKLHKMVHQPYHLVERVVRHLFHAPNKYCKTPMRQLFPKTRENLVCEMFELSGVNPEARCFQLLNEDFVKLANAYAVITEREPELIHYDFKSKAEAKVRRFGDGYTIAIEDAIMNNKYM